MNEDGKKTPPASEPAYVATCDGASLIVVGIKDPVTCLLVDRLMEVAARDGMTIVVHDPVHDTEDAQDKLKRVIVGAGIALPSSIDLIEEGKLQDAKYLYLAEPPQGKHTPAPWGKKRKYQKGPRR